MKKTKYSEVFYSLQGEGKFTGQRTLWLRYFSCNLNCDGFSQTDPTDPSTYELPYEKIDITDITRVEDLPVFEKGCDSSYTWSKKFRHLMKEGTAEEISTHLLEYLPHGKFTHPLSKQTAHMCFTGGEPLTKINQKTSSEILREFVEDGNIPGGVTFETNGTQKIIPEFAEEIAELYDRGLPKIFWSVSPKLFTVSGEKADKAIKPCSVRGYKEVSDFGQLKFVLGQEERQWQELYNVIAQFRDEGIDWPVYIMPLGATKEQQEDVVSIVNRALDEGFEISARAHCYIYGNTIGT